MKNLIFKVIILGLAVFALANPVLAQTVGGLNVQTNSATNIYSNQATLNGYFSYPYFYTSTNNVWFQYGTDTSYSYSTQQQNMSGNSGTFSQTVSNLQNSATYHFRAVVQNNNGTFYGQDMTFYTNNNGYNYGYGNLNITKRVLNLSSGTLSWSSAVYANPNQLVAFSVTIEATGRDFHNVYVRDVLPANLVYRGSTLISGISTGYYGNDITAGINIGTIPAGQAAVLVYQAQVAQPSNFTYGTTTLSNNVTVTSSEASSQTATASVFVNNNAVYTNPSSVPTGTTNHPITDSFFIPLVLISAMSYLYFTGRVYQFADWLGEKIN